MNLLPLLVDSVKTPVRHRITTSDMVAVVGELFARSQTRRFAHNLVAFDHELTAVGVHDDPFPTEKSDRAIRTIFDRDEVNEGVWFIRRQRRPAVVIGEFIKTGD